MKDMLDRYTGCLIGGAVGDALGYAVEFLEAYQIFRQYGERGITEYALTDGVAQISDDTQMTVFTADALCRARKDGVAHADVLSYIQYIKTNYKAWYVTQTQPFSAVADKSASRLMHIPQLYAARAPGCTCLSVIQAGSFGTVHAPTNRSKGCGGVMRVAPIGLFFSANVPTEDVDMLGAEAAALTHGHSLGFIPAAALTHMLRCILHHADMSLGDVVEDMLRAVKRQFANDRYISEFEHVIRKAVALSAEADLDDLDAIQCLGEGWVAEETLAIAVYCALKYQHDFEKAVIAAVNHGGDSDSTGAVTGNILGAYLGVHSIAPKFTQALELCDVISDIAADLYDAARSC